LLSLVIDCFDVEYLQFDLRSYEVHEPSIGEEMIFDAIDFTGDLCQESII
jgi:hypothetical protein